MKKLNTIVMWIAGLFLIIGGAMKVEQMLTEPIISDGFWESWEFFFIQVPLELGLGIWLICGLFKKAAHLLGSISYFGFIFVTLHKAIMGQASCGCFGTVEVNPWITLLVIDVPIFLMLIIFRPKGEKLLPPPWPSTPHFFSIAIPTFILLPSIEIVLLTHKQQRPNVEEWLVKKPAPIVKTEPNIVIDVNTFAIEENDANIIDVNIPSQPSITTEAEPNIPQPEPVAKAEPVIEAEPWPLLKDIDISEQLSSSLWVVLLYHNDCPDCAEAIPLYEQINESLAGNEGAINFSFIEMPPHSRDISQRLVKADTKILCGRLTAEKKWFLESPVVVILNDGSAVGAWEGYAPNLDEIFTAAFGK